MTKRDVVGKYYFFNFMNVIKLKYKISTDPKVFDFMPDMTQAISYPYTAIVFLH